MKYMKYGDYLGSIEYSEEDECLYGKIIGITDAVIYEADSVSELKRLFEKSVDDYLAFCRDKGVTPEKSCKGSFNVRISPELHMQTVMFARDHDMTLNNVVMEAIRAYV